MSKSINTLINEGAEYLAIGEYNKALKSLNKVTEMESSNELAWFLMGNVLIKLKRFADAVVCYNKAIELVPDYKEAYNAKAIALIKQDNISEAKKCIDKSIMIDPDFSETLKIIKYISEHS